VIGDLAGFVASTYRRGIPYVQVPTTLLAQVDSSIGGKTGVDLPEGKNLVGTFYQPRLVVSDVAALSSLPARQMRSGLAEVIKYGVLSGGGLFAFLEKHLQDVLRHDRASLEAVVGACARIKAGIVSRDEQEEKSLRTHLNFGHTIGHAIESAAGYRRYTHGEAVALGMLCACDISRALGLTGADAGLKVEGLIRQSGLPFVIEGLNASQIIAAHYHDKKFSGAENRFVLVRDIGRTAIVKNVPLPVIAAAVKNRLST
jgi:3-dehydroquinate synthase